MGRRDHARRRGPDGSIARSSHEKPYLVNPSLTSFASPAASAEPKPNRIAAYSEWPSTR